jgi:hypothetical protein
MRPLGSAKTCRSTRSACRSPISARASPPPARVATSAGAPASGEVLIVHALLNTDLTSRLINGDWACREVGAEQCRRYGLHGLALRAAAARHAGCFGRRNCNVNLDDLRWDRPDLDCEPQQARDIPAIFNWTRQNGDDGNAKKKKLVVLLLHCPREGCTRSCIVDIANLHPGHYRSRP